MTTPLLVLSIGAVFVGVAVQPFTHWFTDFLGTSPSLDQARTSAHVKVVEHHLNMVLMGVSAALALGGIGVAFVLYRNGGAEKALPGMDGLFALSRNKLYVDEIYNAV